MRYETSFKQPQKVGLRRRVAIRLSQRFDLSQKCLNATRNSTTNKGKVKAQEWPKSSLKKTMKFIPAVHLISTSTNPLFCKETTKKKDVKKLSQNSCLKTQLSPNL